MIQTNSLRRGNWLNYTGESAGWHPIGHIKVSEILDDGVNLSQGDMMIYEAELLEGIPLTHEILEACGLIDASNGMLRFGDLFNKETGELFLNWRHLPVKYLHELQNVYYCQSGKELEVNLPSN